MSALLYKMMDMEAVARFMATRPEKSILYDHTISARHIPFRYKELKFKPPYQYRPGAFEYLYKESLSDWDKTGGILAIRSRKTPSELFPCDYAFFVEPPESLNQLKRLTYRTRHAIAIYRPPTWRFQDKGVAARAPDASLCQTVEETLQGLRACDQDAYEKHAVVLSRFDPQSSVGYRKEPLLKLLGLNSSQFNCVLYFLDGAKTLRYRVLKLNYEPSESYHQDVYTDVKKHEVEDGYCVYSISKHSSAIRSMIRNRYLIYKESITVTQLSPNTDYELCNLKSKYKLQKWEEFKALIDSLPEFPVPRT